MNWGEIMIEKYRLHNLVKYQYSDIGEYVGEGYTDRPLRNDEIVKILNEQDKEISDCYDTIHDLETRNKRQYDLLTEITDLMMERDWKELEKIVEDWEESDRLLQAEWDMVEY